MRALFSLALLLAACSPSPPPQEEAPPAEAPAPTDFTSPDAAALTAEPVEGFWFFHGDAGVISTAYGPPQSEAILNIVCDAPTGQVAFNLVHALAPDQRTTMRIITRTQTVMFRADSTNEGLPLVRAEIDAGAPSAPLDPLIANQERFAVDVAGARYVFPWDESVGRVIGACD